VLDCDLWACRPSIRDLSPFVDESWHEWLRLGEDAPPSAFELPDGQYFVAGSAVVGAAGTDDAVARLRAHLDAAGARVAILNPGVASGVSGLSNALLAAEVAKAANDWSANTFLDRDDRLRGSILFTDREPERGAEEIRRVGGDPRMLQVLFAYPSYLLGHRALRPVYEAAAELDLPVMLQAGGDFSGSNGGVSPYGRPGGSVLEALVGWEYAGQPHLVSLLLSGTLDRHPGLRIVFSGFGVGWLAPLLWRLDSEVAAKRVPAPELERLPSEQVAAQVRFAVTADDVSFPQLDEALETIGGRGLLLYGSGPRRETGTADGVPGTLRSVAQANAEAAYPRLR
jgi:predicted TIM-barrel fold metal-dependent hydrolase